MRAICLNEFDFQACFCQDDFDYRARMLTYLGDPRASVALNPEGGRNCLGFSYNHFTTDATRMNKSATKMWGWLKSGGDSESNIESARSKQIDRYLEFSLDHLNVLSEGKYLQRMVCTPDINLECKSCKTVPECLRVHGTIEITGRRSFLFGIRIIIMNETGMGKDLANVIVDYWWPLQYEVMNQWVFDRTSEMPKWFLECFEMMPILNWPLQYDHDAFTEYDQDIVMEELTHE